MRLTVGAVLRQLAGGFSARGSRVQWDWNRVGEEVDRAGRACVANDQPGHDEAAARFHRAVAAAWPPGFFAHLQCVKDGDPSGVDDVLDFVEACPRFFRTGYVLDAAIRWLPRPPRSPSQTERLRAVVLAAVSRRLRVPFRRIPSLSRAVESPGLREKLVALVKDPDPAVQDRAIAVLDALPGPPWNAEHAQRRRADDRVGAMFSTAYARRSPVLVRRVLGIDPRTLTSRGRKYLAVTFEFAMNWALLPDEDLVEIARRIDGPEMESVWSFALKRSDAPGDRARWLLKRLRGSQLSE
jgi:hypothetical protein